MRTFIICLLSLFLFVNVSAQKLDSLITVLERELEQRIDSLGEEHLDVAIFADSLGNMYFELGSYLKADTSFKKALDIKLKKNDEKHLNVADSYHNVGKVYLKTANYPQAISFNEKALNIRLELLDEKHPDVARSYNNLGIIYRITGDYEKAISFHHNALNIRLELFGEKHSEVARSYNNLGRLYESKGNYEKAVSFHRKALNIRLELLDEKHPDIASSYNNLGVLHAKAGYYGKAISFYNKALNIWLELFGERHPDVAMSYNNLGVMYNKLVDNNKSIAFHHKSLNIKLELLGENHPDIAKSYNNLGNIYRKIGDYEKAISFYKKTLNILLKQFGEKHRYIAMTYHNLGIAYKNIGDYRKAISCNNKASDILLKLFGKNHLIVATSYNNLGNLYLKTRDYEKAIDFHEKALNIRLRLLDEKHADVAKSYNNLGNIYINTGDYEKAIDFHEKALNIRLELLGKWHPDLATSYANLGIIYFDTGNYTKAIDFQDKALKNWLELFGRKHPDVVDFYNNLAILHEEIGNYTTTDSLWNIVIPQSIQELNSTYLFLTDKQRLLYVNTIDEIYENFYSFAANHGTYSTQQLATNYLLNTKSLALDYGISTNQVIKKINDTTLNFQYKQLNIINKQISDAYTLTIEERKEKGWDLSEMNNRQEALTFQMLQHPELKSKLNTETIKWQDVQNKLTPNEATLDFVKFYEDEDSTWQYHAMLIRKDTTPQFIPITQEKVIRDLMEFYEENKLPVYLQNRSTRTALYDKIWSSLEAHLEGIATIHLSPAGLLHKVDFEALQNAEGQYLAERFEFHYYSAMRDFVQPKPTQSYKDAVLMGHILYDIADIEAYKKFEDSIDLHIQGSMWLALRGTRDSIARLEATAKEVKIIGRICKRSDISPTVLTIADATEDTLQYFTGKRAPSILHFATHGVFLEPLDTSQTREAGMRDRLRIADNPLQRSALMLYGANHKWTKNERILGSEKDGILTALEVANLDLQDTDLVVLSACDTGLGSIHNTEGVFGLQRTFKFAGADNILVSLWSVNDRATKELMIRFYRNLLKKEQSPAVALRNAKADIREKNPNPRFWAGFILVE